MTAKEYVYQVVETVKITDGDTYWLRLDVGFRQSQLINCRLLGWDCPETNRGSAYEKACAKAAKQVAADWFMQTVGLGVQVWVQTKKDPDDFGRWLGDLWYESEGSEFHLGQALAASQLATPWPIRWREVYDK